MPEACGLDASHMPALAEAAPPARCWATSPAAGAARRRSGGRRRGRLLPHIAVGVRRTSPPGQGFVSLGTSGVGVPGELMPLPCHRTPLRHALCPRALPRRWHHMSVMLRRGPRLLAWVRRLTGRQGR